MAAATEVLFAQFAAALNQELAACGATFRVDHRRPETAGMLQLCDRDGRAIGMLPDHADAAIILAVERLRVATGAGE